MMVTMPLLSVVYFNERPAACVIIPLICPVAFMEWNLRHLVCKGAQTSSSLRAQFCHLPSEQHTHTHTVHVYTLCTVSPILTSILP